MNLDNIVENAKMQIRFARSKPQLDMIEQEAARTLQRAVKSLNDDKMPARMVVIRVNAIRQAQNKIEKAVEKRKETL